MKGSETVSCVFGCDSFGQFGMEVGRRGDGIGRFDEAEEGGEESGCGNQVGLVFAEGGCYACRLEFETMDEKKGDCIRASLACQSIIIVT
jgi:hypothetical protein